MKLILLILSFLITCTGYSQYKIQFADTVNGKVVIREVSYKYPLPVKAVLADTAKVFQYNNGVINTSFPMKIYNFVKEVQDFYIKREENT